MGFWSRHNPFTSKSQDKPQTPAFAEQSADHASLPQPEPSEMPSDGSDSDENPYQAPGGGLKQVWIAMMGVTGAGKSTFISHLVSEEVQIGHNLQSCTQDVRFYSFIRKDTVVYLVDTPGFDDTNKSDVDVLQELASWLKESYTEDIKLDGIIYLHRITDVRMQGSARKNIRMFRSLCGENYQKKVILATTMWENVGAEVGEQRERELLETEEFWGSMVKRGSRIERHKNKERSAKRLIDYYISGKDEATTLEIQTEMVAEKKELPETAAGKSLEDEITQGHAKLGKERTDVMKLLRESNDANDEDSSQELERHLRIVDLRIKRLQDERKKLAEGLRVYEKSSPFKQMLRNALAVGRGEERRSALQKKRDENERELEELKAQKKLLKSRNGKNPRPSWSNLKAATRTLTERY
ncbi:P-loop containing nucleoside triphosphate hydrolase protein [Schizothecium vesticola]|uniref:P-loop containing nucleoside triphosphate hydrolase protein n=1 Tax=Schizothecium vesticola TaxID=314040 RepID=A0AA40EPD7_9PEZI|nr:P-loop containing nucleoside triphosphate hydrolase protein [Schizothecium vesticola]